MLKTLTHVHWRPWTFFMVLNVIMLIEATTNIMLLGLFRVELVAWFLFESGLREKWEI